MIACHDEFRLPTQSAVRPTRPFPLLALLALLAVMPPPVDASTGEHRAGPGLSTCPDSGRAVLLEGNLPRFSSRVSQTKRLKIVTIGSSSTAGAGATVARNSYPSQLEIDLLRRFPGHAIDVVNSGVNGQEIPDMLDRLDRDVLSHKPDLVIWQFGANGLMRGLPVDVMEVAAHTGIARIKATGADVLLMDLQHAPRIDGVGRRDEILGMMERVAESTDSALFRRYRLMKAWARSMGERYGRMVHEDKLHMTDTSYRCMAGALARSLETAVARPVYVMRGASGVAAATPGDRPAPVRSMTSPRESSAASP